jgi:predicted secreted hydrolase
MAAVRRTPRARVGTLARLAVGIALAASAGCEERTPVPSPAGDVVAALSAPDSEFDRALGPRTFDFPQDHGPHPAFRTEWWYFTGNVADSAGRRFGFELTFFRNALTSRRSVRTSAWASNQAYMAHFALTDVAAHRFHAFQRLERAAVGLAGASCDTFRVWVDDWSATAVEPAGAPGSLGTPRMRLRARQSGVAIDLILTPEMAPVLNGAGGLSRKGPRPGNASYYYSVPRLATRGTVRTPTGSFSVSGLSWLDREWSTSALDADDVGWDWFGLQLSDTTELMLFRLRRRDGRPSPFDAGTVMSARAATRTLAAGAASIAATASWTSPAGARYPAGWMVRIPTERLVLSVQPLLPDQELDLTYRYWEGAVRVTGTRSGRPVQGFGYVELTGYGTVGSVP